MSLPRNTSATASISTCSVFEVCQPYSTPLMKWKGQK